MNKIILHFGALVFCISIIIFSQKSLSISEILLKSFVIFFTVTMITGVLMLVLIKSVNKVSLEKKDINDNILGSKENE